jgi:HK97 family phage portal protein
MLAMLLHPNDHMTLAELMSYMQGCLVLDGQAFAELSRRAGRGPMLYPLESSQVRIDDTDRAYPMYIVHDGRPGTGERVVPASQMLHVRGFGLTPFEGDSPIGLLRDSISGALATERASQASFRNGLRTPGFFRIPAALTAEQVQDFSASMRSLTGADNAGQIPLFHGSSGGGLVEWIATAGNLRDSQSVEARSFEVQSIARAFRIPPHMIGSSERDTRSALEELAREFLTFCIRPWIVRWEQRLDRTLLSPSQRRRLGFSFDTSVLVRANQNERFGAYQSALLSGWMTPNEIRAMEGLPAVPDGDAVRVPLNTTPLGANEEVS